MLNMIKLDWLGMKCYRMRIIVLPIVVTAYGLLSEGIIIPFIAVMMLSFSVNPFAVEEKGKLDNLYLTLPVTRKTIVDTRYCLSLIMQLAGLVFGIVATALMAWLLRGLNIIYVHDFRADAETLSLIASGSLLLYSVMNLSMFPTLFKIGYAKGKALGFYIPIVAMSLILFSVYMLWFFLAGFKEKVLEVITWAYAKPLAFSAIILALAALILLVSYTISRRVYAKREF